MSEYLLTSLKRTSNTGPVCDCCALGTVCQAPTPPLTSQHRSWLSHEPETRKFCCSAGGEKARLEIESSGGAVTSTSLLGLWAPKLAPTTLPAVAPKALCWTAGCTVDWPNSELVPRPVPMLEEPNIVFWLVPGVAPKKLIVCVYRDKNRDCVSQEKSAELGCVHKESTQRFIKRG